MSGQVLRLEGLTKRYGQTCAIEDLTLEVAPGEIVALLGPNGAGKTTTVKLVCGLLRPTAGRVMVGGIDARQFPLAAKRLIGYVPERPFLYEKLSGGEFLRLCAGLYRVEDSEAARRTAELISYFEADSFQDQLIEHYSHGMRQRLVLIAALLHCPKLLLVDEPMVGLDPHGAMLVKRLFQGLAAQGTSVLMSTHSLDSAGELAGRLAVVSKGRLVALGTVAEVCQQSGEETLEAAYLKLTGASRWGGLPGFLE